MNSYKVIRFHRERLGRTRTIKRGLTLEQAQEHCTRQETHRYDKDGHVIWFDGYTREE